MPDSFTQKWLPTVQYRRAKRPDDTLNANGSFGIQAKVGAYHPAASLAVLYSGDANTDDRFPYNKSLQ